MAPKGKGKKKDSTSVDGLGWDLEDIGVPLTSSGLIRMVPGRGQMMASGQIADTAKFTLGLTGGGPGQAVIPTTPTQLPHVSPSVGTEPYLQDAARVTKPVTTADGRVVASPEQSQQVRNYIENPNLIDRVVNPTKDWLSRLFDTSDPDKSAAFGLENLWDGTLTALNWGYDKLNQVTAAGISGLPGGIDTLTWDQAGDVSVGQAFIGSMGATAGRMKRGQANAGDIAMLPLSLISTGLSALDPNNAAQKAAFDITREADRKAAFESGMGKFASGAVDTAFTIFADPLIMGGKALKLARLTWIDRPISSVDDITRLSTELAEGMVKQTEGRINEAAPVAQFAAWAIGTNEKTGARRTMQEIFYHPVVRRSADREGIAAALASADNYDDASLVIRYAAGDSTARAALFKKRADLASEIDTAQRKALELRIAYNPEVRAEQIARYKDQVTALDKELKDVEKAWAAGNATDEELEFARRQLDRSVENLRNVKDIRLPDPLANPVSKEDVSAADAIVNQLTERNQFLKKALADEMKYALTQSTKGFAADNALGRMVERSRQRRTAAAYETSVTQRRRTVTGEDTSRATRFWVKDDFGNGALRRTVRLWRYLGNETPSGYITTKGTGAMESVREIMAALNDISIYGGKARTVTQTKDGKVITAQVGGLARKEELVKMYADALSDSMKGTEAAKYAVDRIENAIMNDIALWYKIPAQDARDLLWKAQGKRQDLLKQIRERGYWVDEEGNINKSPFLESQLQNGTFMLNYRAFEKAARRADESRIIRAWDSSTGYSQERLTNLYEGFNDFWRPAVLLRLGYTQRNVTEGLFRSSAFLFSLDPARYALGNAAYSARNAVMKIKARNAAKALEKTGDSKMFTEWRANQMEAAEKRILDQETTIAELRNAAKSAGLTPEELADELENIKVFERMLESTREFRKGLDEDDVAKALFTQQGYAKRRVMDGSIPGLKYGVLREAFNPDSGYADIAWANMSADNTQRAVASLSADRLGALFRKKLEKTFVSVTPDKPKQYAEGVASALNQFKNSELGSLIIQGKSADEIAIFLRKDPTGREIAAFLTRAEIVPKNGKAVQRVIDMDDAREVATSLIARYQSIAPTAEIQRYMRATTTVDSRAIEKMLKGVPADTLKPVIGNIAEEVGFKNIRETWVSIADKGFKYLGTLPEDAFVRAPFYGLRYRKAAQTYYDIALQQSKTGKVSMREIAQIQRIAHRRALKDTKDWLYTIDRRTTLGRVGEYAFPFISATQNSVSTIGRIIWNDPSIIGVTALLWNAPDKLGWTDENGKIRVSFPLDLLPQGVKEQFGLDNMLNVTFDKNQFNVVFPESGFGLLPRFGPIVAAPASEIMKAGWFGMTVDTPGVLGFLDQAFGEGAADEFWTNWKKYLYGEEGGVSPETFSWKMFAPPVIAKFFEMWQGEGSSASYAYAYNLQMRNEYAKWLGGYRDTEPTPEELKQRTNGYYWARIIANLTAFTPPTYESKLDPLIQAIRENDRIHGSDGPRISNDQFGNLLLMLGDFSTSKNVAGLRSATADQVKVAREHAGLIAKIAPNLGDDLSVLGVLLNRDVNALYDPSASAWQRTANIPGTSEKFRKLQTPEEAMVESSRQAGWVAWIQLSEQLKSVLQQRGLSSFRSAGASDLRQMRDQAIAQMRNNPLYRGWYDDFIEFGSQRTINTVELLREATGDQKWMAENGESPVWQAAQLYLFHRNKVLEGLAVSGKGINASSNRQIREYWDSVRADLDNKFNGWSVISSRFLSGDDDPETPGASLTAVDQTEPTAGLQLFDGQMQGGLQTFDGVEEVPGG